jgi:hypothetical protein
MSTKIKNIIGALSVAVVLVISIAMIAHPGVSELAGLAVAQSSTQWNSVIDASKGDGQTSGILGQSTYLFNGLTFDRLRAAPTADASAATGFLPVGLEGYNGTAWDRIRAGLTVDGNVATGLLNVQNMGFNGSTYDRFRSSLVADGQAATGLQNNGNMIFNASTWDRMRTASGDGLAVTGIQGSGQLLWNGATFDRVRSASATNNTATTSLGGVLVTQLSTWSVTNTQTGAVQATASKAAGGGTVRNVATGVTICRGDTAVAAPALVNLRDGATGAGTILRSWVIGIDTANGSKCENVTGLNMTGSANTAMTLEFAAAGSATSTSTVTLTGYSTP